MLIGKLYGMSVAMVLLISGCTLSNAETTTVLPTSSWWLENEYTANVKKVGNLDVSTINKDWQSLAVFDFDFFENKLNRVDYRFLKNSQLSFTVSADIDNNSIKEKFVVGTYTTQQKESGRFVLILRDDKVLNYFTHPGFSGFSGLYQQDNEIRWYKCLECSDYDTIKWTGSHYVLE